MVEGRGEGGGTLAEISGAVCKSRGVLFDVKQKDHRDKSARQPPHSGTAALRTYLYIITPPQNGARVVTCISAHARVFAYGSNPCISRMVLLSTPVYIVYIIPLGVFVLRS